MDTTLASATTDLAQPPVLEDLLEHREFLHRMVHGLLGDSHDCDDVVQQTWLAVLTTGSDSVRKPKTWLAKIAKNRSIDMIRRRRVRRVREQAADEPDQGPGPDEAMEQDSVRTTVCDAVERLAEPYRESIRLRFYEGLPPREVARRMGVPVETARTRIKRALASLRSRLDGEFPGGRKAWMVACLRLVDDPRIAPTGPSFPLLRPITIAASLAGLAALALWARPRILAGEETANAQTEDVPIRVVLKAPSAPGWRNDANREGDVLGGERTDAWPPEPAVEVEDELPVETGREHPLENATWGMLLDQTEALDGPVRTAARQGALLASQAVAHDAQATPRGFGGASFADLDGPSPLDVALEDRIRPERIWRVSADGSGDFLDLPQAVAAASSGDVLLLTPTSTGYEHVELRKGLSIVGLGSEPVRVRGLTIEGLQLNQNVILRNVRFEPRAGRTALILRNVPSSVWIEDCELASVDADGIRSHDCAAVTILRTHVRVEADEVCEEPLAAMRGLATDVSFYGSSLIGNAGVDGTGASAGCGGHGAILSFGRMYAMSTHFEGGAGGNAMLSGHATRGGDGGVGLWSEGAARSLGCTYVGGDAGGGPRGLGLPGAPWVAPLEILAGTPRSYSVDALTSAQGTAHLEATGEPGDVLMSVVSGAPSKGYLLLHLGTRLVAPPYHFEIEGVIPPNGTFEKTVRIPAAMALGGGFERYYAQGFFFTSKGEAFLAEASTVFVLPVK